MDTMTRAISRATMVVMLVRILRLYLALDLPLRDLEPQWKLQVQLLLRIIGNRNWKLFSDPDSWIGLRHTLLRKDQEGVLDGGT